jgi:hypothetical protein
MQFGNAAARTSRWILLLLTTAFVARGVYLSLALPYGAPLDEPYHYAYASFFETTGRPPRGAEPSVSAELVRAQGKIPRPSVWETSDASFAHFSRLPASERSIRRSEAFALVPSERKVWVFPNYESQQPPLAYLLAIPLLRLLEAAPIDSRLLALRLFGTLIAAAAVPLVYALLRRFLQRRTALAATAAYVAFPGVGMFVGRFTNDQLALPLMTGLLLFLAVVAEGGLKPLPAVALGALLAAGLWTKLYFLSMLPAVLCAAGLSPRPVRGRTLALAAGAVLAAGIAFLPWVTRQRSATGDWFGLTETVQARGLGVTFVDLLGVTPQLVDPERLAVFARTFVWPGTWTWMGAPWPVSPIVAAGLLAVVVFVRPPPSVIARPGLAALGFALFWFITAQAIHAANFFAIGRKVQSAPVAGHEGWYLLSLLPVLLLAGEGVGRTRCVTFTALAVLCVLVDATLQFGLLPGCYAGIFGIPGTPMTEALRIAFHPRFAFAALAVVSLVGFHGRELAAIAATWLGLICVGIALVNWSNTTEATSPRPPLSPAP